MEKTFSHNLSNPYPFPILIVNSSIFEKVWINLCNNSNYFTNLDIHTLSWHISRHDVQENKHEVYQSLRCISLPNIIGTSIRLANVSIIISIYSTLMCVYKVEYVVYLGKTFILYRIYNWEISLYKLIFIKGLFKN